MVSIQERVMMARADTVCIYFADRNLTLHWVEIFSENPSSHWIEIFSENPSAQQLEVLENLISQCVEIFSGAMHIQNGLKKCLWRLNLQWVEVDSEATQLPKWVEIFSKDPKSQ